jgi:serine/threonine protein phosphatase PrpC
MGAMLSAPVELINVQRSGNEFYRAAVADMQGWRSHHEDAHDMRSNASAGSFWVLDGHGGDSCARYCSPKLGEEFLKGGYAVDEAIEQGFSGVDQSFLNCGSEYADEDSCPQSGSTVVGCITEHQPDGSYNVKLVNCGDSRALLVRGPDATEECEPLQVRLPQHLVALGSQAVASPAGTSDANYRMPNKGSNPRFGCRWPLIAESVDHKPSHPTEKKRIEDAGGFVTGMEPARLDGNLAVSRGLGDFEYKADKQLSAGEQKASCVPDIYEVKNVPAGSFIVLACDGLWDVCTGEYIANVVRDRLKENPKCDLGELVVSLLRTSFYERLSKDNITCMIVQLTDGSDYKCVSDEMRFFEKLQPEENRGDGLDDDSRKNYVNFLHRYAFPDKPVPCSSCKRWLREMSQCPCQTVFYCCRACQKKGWKTHKASCPMLAGEAEAERSPELQ